MRRHIAFCAVVLVFLGLGYYWWPKPVERTYQGWLTSYDSAVNEPVEIQLRGTIARSLISHHRFSGHITVKGITIETVSSVAGNLSMSWAWIQERWRGQVMNTTLGAIGEDGYLKIFGGFRLANDLSEVAGFLQEVDGVYPEHHLSFAGPATNSNQVWGILNNLAWGKSFLRPGKTVEEAIKNKSPLKSIVYEQEFMDGRIVLYETTRSSVAMSYVSKTGSQWIAEGGAWFEPEYDSDHPLTWDHKSWGRTRRSADDDFLETYLGIVHDPRIDSVRISTSGNPTDDAYATIVTLGEHRLWFVLLAPEAAATKITGLSYTGDVLFEVLP